MPCLTAKVLHLDPTQPHPRPAHLSASASSWLEGSAMRLASSSISSLAGSRGGGGQGGAGQGRGTEWLVEA